MEFRHQKLMGCMWRFEMKERAVQLSLDVNSRQQHGEEALEFIKKWWQWLCSQTDVNGGGLNQCRRSSVHGTILRAMELKLIVVLEKYLNCIWTEVGWIIDVYRKIMGAVRKDYWRWLSRVENWWWCTICRWMIAAGDGGFKDGADYFHWFKRENPGKEGSYWWWSMASSIWPVWEDAVSAE